MGDEDESDLAKAARELSGMKVFAKDGQLREAVRQGLAGPQCVVDCAPA